MVIPCDDDSKSIGDLYGLYGGAIRFSRVNSTAFGRYFSRWVRKSRRRGAKVRFISPPFPIWDQETSFSLVAAFLTQEDKADSHPSPFQKTVERVKGRDFQKIFSRSVIPSNRNMVRNRLSVLPMPFTKMSDNVLVLWFVKPKVWHDFEGVS